MRSARLTTAALRGLAATTALDERQGLACFDYSRNSVDFTVHASNITTYEDPRCRRETGSPGQPDKIENIPDASPRRCGRIGCWTSPGKAESPWLHVVASSQDANRGRARLTGAGIDHFDLSCQLRRHARLGELLGSGVLRRRSEIRIPGCENGRII